MYRHATYISTPMDLCWAGAESHEPFIFTKLPPELRIMIWEHVYCDCIEVKPSQYLPPGGYFPPSQAHKTRSSRFMISQLTISRQWFNEAIKYIASNANWGFPDPALLENFREVAPSYITLNIKSVTLLNLGNFWASPLLFEHFPNLQHLTITVAPMVMERIWKSKVSGGLKNLLHLSGLRSFEIDICNALAGQAHHNLITMEIDQQMAFMRAHKWFEERVRRTVTRPRSAACQDAITRGLQYYQWDGFETALDGSRRQRVPEPVEELLPPRTHDDITMWNANWEKDSEWQS